MKKLRNLILVLLTVAIVFSVELANAQNLSAKNKIIFKKAEKLTRQKKYITAVRYYEQILKSSENIETVMKIADIYFIFLPQKNYKKALNYYKRAEQDINTAISKNPKLGKRRKIKELKQTCTNNIKICLSQMGEIENAKNRYKDAKEKFDKENFDDNN